MDRRGMVNPLWRAPEAVFLMVRVHPVQKGRSDSVSVVKGWCGGSLVRVRVIMAADKKDCLQLTQGAVTEQCQQVKGKCDII